MAGEFSGIGADGAGYAISPQDVLKRDLPLLEALQQAPQHDPLVRREERSLTGEMEQALQGLQAQRDPELSHEQMVENLARQILEQGGEGAEGGMGSGYGFNPSMFQGGLGNNPFGTTYGDPSYQNLRGNNGGYSGYGGGYSGQYLNNAGAYNNGFEHGYDAGENAQAGIDRYAAAAGAGDDDGIYDQPFAGLYDGGSGDQGGYSTFGFNGTTAANSGAAFQFNSDGSVTSPDAKTGYTPPSPGTSHPDLLHVADQDLPGGFALNSEAKDGNTRSVNGEVNGHKVEVWTDNDGSVKAQVDGKPVPKGGSDPNGIVTGNSDGSFTIKGSNDATGASINVQVGANMVHGHQQGLTTTVSNVNGPNGQPLHLGGFMGNALQGH